MLLEGVAGHDKNETDEEFRVYMKCSPECLLSKENSRQKREWASDCGTIVCMKSERSVPDKTSCVQIH